MINNEILLEENLKEIMDIIFQSEMGKWLFKNKIGNKYINDHFVKMSDYKYSEMIKVIKFDEEEKTLCKEDYLNLLRTLLPNEEMMSSDGCFTHTWDIKGILPEDKKDLYQVYQYYRFKKLIDEIEDLVTEYFYYVLQIAFKVYTDNFELEPETKQSFENLLLAYLCRLADETEFINQPTQCKISYMKSYYYDEKNVILIPVDSVANYVHTLTEVLAADLYTSGQEVFYRGQSNSSYSLIPSICRTLKERYYEKNMISELERECPEDFQASQNLLDKLVEMQHYGLPTRLLDITSNALVALLFACSGGSKVDGEVILMKTDRDSVCYGQSDKVSLLCAISQMNYEEQDALFEVTEVFRLIDEDIESGTYLPRTKSYISHLGKLNYIGISSYTEMQLKSITEELEKILNNNNDYEDYPDINLVLTTKFNEIDIVNRLVKIVQIDKPYFEARINPRHLRSVLFVKPAKLNQRIIKQSGAFMVCGAMSLDNGGVWENINQYRCTGVEEGKRPVIIIQAKNKARLLEQLKICGLHEANIYPEIDKVADYIKTDHKERKFF